MPFGDIVDAVQNRRAVCGGWARTTVPAVSSMLPHSPHHRAAVIVAWAHIGALVVPFERYGRSCEPALKRIAPDVAKRHSLLNRGLRRPTSRAGAYEMALTQSAKAGAARCCRHKANSRLQHRFDGAWCGLIAWKTESHNGERRA